MPTPPIVQNVYYDADFPLMSGGAGAWQVYRYQQVRELLFDYATYGNGYMPDNGMLGSNLNQIDPPLHGQLRALISRFFSRGAIAGLEQDIENACRSLLAGCQDKTVDVARDFAFPLTATVICEVLGISSGTEIMKVNNWAKAIVTAGYVEGGLAQAAVAQQEMAGLFMQLLQSRAAEPRADLLSALALAEVGADALAPAAKIGTCMTILLAGYETTANLITSAVHQLSVDHQLQATIRQSPAIIPNFLQEVLRLYPSIVSMYRIARKDVVLEGQLIKAGDIINGWISTANRDPELFAEPDKLDLDRHNSSQALSFGYGIHHCIGAALARTQARIALEVLLRESTRVMPGDGEPVRTPSLITPGFQTLPITL
ncbi:Cytochrome P450 [Chitinophaga eiseniae]|uniref:Cytochrome P450 n=1 Tax=Chitinophaga eiseniae TaxID=634771 RepID=A0A1T4SY70_9BACT|nr:cytochrome P450 [Chitinophaga eiseniae]SKA32868.1 Cytochrome P450 [Chitinophaga eiseniae]